VEGIAVLVLFHLIRDILSNVGDHAKMDKVKVKLVKYDMTKTKNRKRTDMLVDSKTEKAVITQLERIHKGEQVVKIHEITWDEKQIEEVLLRDEKEAAEYFKGTVKFYNSEKAFGFIKADDDMEDLFFHKTACKEGLPGDQDRVEFKVSEGPKGLIATHVRVIFE
jgi:cold shock CspA family protein